MSETLNIPDWIKDARCYAVPVGAILCKVEDGELWWYKINAKGPHWIPGLTPQLREAWERLPDKSDGLYVAVERRVECPRCHGDGYVVADDKLFMCSQCNATGTIKRLDLERAIELPYTRVLNHEKEWRTAHPDIPLSPIPPENYIKSVLKYCDYAALFFTDGTHEAVIKREDVEK